jgi:hypothetical protein
MVLELLTGIEAVQRQMRESLEPRPPARRRRPPARGSRIAAGGRFLAEAMVALTVPAPTRTPASARGRARPDRPAVGASRQRA